MGIRIVGSFINGVFEGLGLATAFIIVLKVLSLLGYLH